MSAERARALALIALAAGVLAGCGEKPEPDVSKIRTVTGTLDLARPAPGSPDAGTTAGHRAPDATATTSRSSMAFTGTVRPAAAQLTLRPQRGGAARVTVGGDGRFRARARGLRRGQNHFVLEGRVAGLEPWIVDVAITRR
jgi:hypothetical protein